MSTTGIVILSLFILIIVIVIIRGFFSFVNQKKPKNVEVVIKESNKEIYQKQFFKLKSIYDANIYLQKEIGANDTRKLNKYISHYLQEFMDSPEYIFSIHVNEFQDLVVNFSEKLIKESPFIWEKKSIESIAMLNYKCNEFKNSNNELLKYNSESFNNIINKGTDEKETKLGI